MSKSLWEPTKHNAIPFSFKAKDQREVRKVKGTEATTDADVEILLS